MVRLFFISLLLFFSQVLMAQVPSFTISSNDSLFCNPSTVTFTSTVAGSPIGYIWNFGNGLISNSKNPSTTYANAGTYDVTLLVIYKQNTAQFSKSITINPGVTATLGLDRDFICTAGDINFTSASSASPAMYEWNFGDGSAPVKTNNNTISHQFTQIKTYEVSLKAISADGCSVTKTTSVRMAPISVSGSVSVDSGCIPASTTLIAYPEIPANSTVTNYEWDFNDGSALTTTATQSINYIYNQAGSFQPKVKVTTNEGCEAILPYKNLGFGIPPTNQVASAEKDIICGVDSAVFNGSATNANSYYWDFGDGEGQFVSGNQVKHKYRSLGNKTVTMIPIFNRCQGTPVTFTIEVVGVIASFIFENSCNQKETFRFTNTSLGNLSSNIWRTGDGSGQETTRDIIHTYPQSGEFFTYLLIKDDITGCADSAAALIYTAQPRLINPDTSICRNSSSTFKIDKNNESSITTYTWHVAGEVVGPIYEETLTLSARNLGSYNNYVSINRGDQYCRDTLYLNHSYVVRGPDLNFSAPDVLCFGIPFEAVNTSKPARPQDSVSMWYWNFGSSAKNDTIYQPKPYKFQSPGYNSVKLVARDIKGCIDSLVKDVLINPIPFLFTIPQLDTLCSGESASLIAFNSGALDWKSTAAIPCITCDTIIVAPNITSAFIATATSLEGCSTSDTILVKVYSPFVANPVASESYICLNEEVTLNVSPPEKIVAWTTSSGSSNSSSYEITTIPRETTTYTVTMRDSVGCFNSTANITVNVKSLPQVDAGPDKVLPFNSSFTINPTYSNNVAVYNWAPSNTLSCFSCPNPSGFILDSKTYTIEVKSDSGCVATDSINISVECKYANIFIPNAFTPNNDNLNDVFYPITRGIKLVKAFAIYDRYGKLVFERKNFEPNNAQLGWNGKRNGMDQTSNVYVYYFEAECYEGETLQKRGSVTLLK